MISLPWLEKWRNDNNNAIQKKTCPPKIEIGKNFFFGSPSATVINFHFYVDEMECFKVKRETFYFGLFHAQISNISSRLCNFFSSLKNNFCLGTWKMKFCFAVFRKSLNKSFALHESWRENNNFVMSSGAPNQNTSSKLFCNNYHIA